MPRFTPDFLDELRTRLRASDVIGRYVKLKKQGREWCGLSPFTNEKTPSFYVNDDKARYFDFSSGKSGDIIGFLIDSQKLTFVEAVSRLADEAGMEIPKDTPEEARRAEAAKGLAEACEAAAQFYQESLRRIEGRKARAYLEGRRVAEGLQQTFTLGYAPAGRHNLKDFLVNKGFAVPLLVEAGLLIQPEDGSAAYDRFRDRIMFPILGGRNRVIAFGGRALEKNVKAKYLNSPETPLFHKGNVLYNYMRARKAAADLPKQTNQALIVCEGYMDVIALAGAGFGHVVAPLGTALTENQLTLLWRACDEPLLCFDGDRAGQQAAFRAIDRALPLLTPGKSLRFAFLPEGLDPDDLLREKGASALASVLEAALPMAEVLWARERDAQPLTTPERKAAFRAHLRQLVKAIADKDVRGAYGNYFSGKLAEQGAPKPRAPFRPGGGRRQSGRGGVYQPPVEASTALKSRLGTGSARAGDTSRREALLVYTLLNHPGLFERQEEALMTLRLKNSALSGLLQEIIGAITADPALDRDGLARHMSNTAQTAGTLELMLTNEQLKLTKFARADAILEEAEEGWLNTLSLHLHHGQLRAEEMEAASEVLLDETAEQRWRISHSHRHAVVAAAKGQEDVQSGDG